MIYFSSKEELINHLILTVYLLFLLLWNSSNLPREYCFFPIMAVGFFALTLYAKKYSKIFIFYIVLSCFGVISNTITQNRSLLQLLYIFAYCGIAITIIDKPIKINYAKSMLILCSIVTFIRQLKGFNAYSFIKTGSMSTDVVLLIFFFVYVVSCFQNHKQIQLFYVFLPVISVLFSLKRAGIIVWIVILLYMAFKKMKNIKSFFFYVLITTISIIIIYIVLRYYFPNIYISINNRFMRDGISINGLVYSRKGIWRTYLLELKGISRILFGVPYECNVGLISLGGNMHLSFFTIHSYYGLIGVVLYVYIAILSIIKWFRLNNDIMGFLCIAIIIRGLSDLVYWINTGDPMFIAITAVFFYEYLPNYRRIKK